MRFVPLKEVVEMSDEVNFAIRRINNPNLKGFNFLIIEAVFDGVTNKIERSYCSQEFTIRTLRTFELMAEAWKKGDPHKSFLIIQDDKVLFEFHTQDLDQE